MEAWILPGLIGFAVVVYLGWGMVDRRRHHAFARAHAAAGGGAALPDAPLSLHPEVSADQCIGSGACTKACPEHDILAMVDGQAKLINPLACVGHGACMSACPVGAIKLVFGTARRGFELPAVSPQFETSQPGIYVVGELGGMGLIRNATEQGRQAAAYLAASERRGDGGQIADAIVIGAGPSGIAATLGLIDAGLRVKLIEQGELGGTARHYPRAKVVMTGSLELPRFGTVKKKTMTKEELIELWEEIHRTVGLPLETGIKVVAIEPDGDAWRVRGENGWEGRAANVVLALGRRGTPRPLDVPGEQLPKVSYRLIETAPFRGQRVLVVGGGNAAAECALALADSGECDEVALSYRRTELARLRAGVRDRLDIAFASGKVRAMLGTQVVKIDKRTVDLEHGDGSVKRIPNDGLIVQIGGQPPSELLKSAGIQIVEKFGEA